MAFVLLPLSIGTLVVALAAFPVSDASAAATAPSWAASSFAVLAGSGITNTGPTTLNGDLGSFPTTSIWGTGTMTVTGVNHGGDAVTQQAKNDLVTAYNAVASEGPTIPITGDLGGLSLTAGVYNSSSSIGLTGALTLDAQGNPNAVFVFQGGSTLTTATGADRARERGSGVQRVLADRELGDARHRFELRWRRSSRPRASP